MVGARGVDGVFHLQEVQLAAAPFSVRCKKPLRNVIRARRISNTQGVEIRIRVQNARQPRGKLLSIKASRSELRGQIVGQAMPGYFGLRMTDDTLLAPIRDSGSSCVLLIFF